MQVKRFAGEYLEALSGPTASLDFEKTSVEYMPADQLGPTVRNLIGNADPTRAAYGVGLGLAVRLMGSVGDFTWPGRQRHLC